MEGKGQRKYSSSMNNSGILLLMLKCPYLTKMVKWEKNYKILWSFCLNLKSIGIEVEEAKKRLNLNLELFGWHFPRLLWFPVSRKIFLKPIWIFMCYFNRFSNRTSTIHHILFFEYSFVVFLINICHAILFNKFIILVFSGLKILFDYWRLHTTPLMLLENFSRV